MTTPGYTVPLSSQSEAPCFETTMPTPEKDSKQPSLGSHICPWKVTEQTGRRYLNRDVDYVGGSRARKSLKGKGVPAPKEEFCLIGQSNRDSLEKKTCIPELIM